MNIPDRTYNNWLEGALQMLYEMENVRSIGLQVLTDGDVMTAYYNANLQDKAIMKHNIECDMTMDFIEANKTMIKELLEEDDEPDSDQA